MAKPELAISFLAMKGQSFYAIESLKIQSEFDEQKSAPKINWKPSISGCFICDLTKEMKRKLP